MGGKSFVLVILQNDPFLTLSRFFLKMSNKYGWRLKSPPTGEDKDFVSTLMDTIRVAHYYGSPHVILDASILLLPSYE